MPKDPNISDEDKKEATPPVDYTKDIRTPSLEDIAKGMEDGDSKDTPAKGKDDTAKVDDKDTKDKDAAVDDKKDEKDTPPVIDAEKLKEEISNATAKKIVDALAPDDATKKDKQDLLKDAPWTKEKREPTWQEALDYMADKNKSIIKQELLQELADEVKAEEDKEAKAAQDAKDYEEQRKDAWHKQWNAEEQKLVESGKLVKILRPDDENDLGRKQRIDIYTQMKEHNEKMVKDNTPEKQTMNLVEFYHLYYKPSTAQPAGAKAPVAGARRAVTPTNPGEFSYGEIHGKSLDQIARGE